MPLTTLAEFLQLSDADQEIAKNIQHLLQDSIKNENALFTIVTETDLVLLIKYALTFPDINQLCNQKKFDVHWKEIWQQCGEYGNNTRYLPQRIMSNFDLIKGIYLYWEYVEQNKTVEKQADKNHVLDFLQLAAQQGCFDALNTICFILLENDIAVLYQDAITYAEQAAQQHLAPGYELLSRVYLNIKDKLRIDQPFLIKALKAIFLAEKLGPFSKAEINNAYSCDTLTEALGMDTAQACAMLLADVMNSTDTETHDRGIKQIIFNEANALAKEEFSAIDAQYGLSQAVNLSERVEAHKIVQFRI